MNLGSARMVLLIRLYKCNVHLLSLLMFSVLERRQCGFHFSDDKTEARKGKMIYPKSLSKG